MNEGSRPGFLTGKGETTGEPHTALCGAAVFIREPGAQRDLHEEVREQCLLASLGSSPWL